MSVRLKVSVACDSPYCIAWISWELEAREFESREVYQTLPKGWWIPPKGDVQCPACRKSKE